MISARWLASLALPMPFVGRHPLFLVDPLPALAACLLMPPKTRSRPHLSSFEKVRGKWYQFQRAYPGWDACEALHRSQLRTLQIKPLAQFLHESLVLLHLDLQFLFSMQQTSTKRLINVAHTTKSALPATGLFGSPRPLVAQRRAPFPTC